jgi:hypothetical protein
MKKMLLQMTSGFLQLESTLNSQDSWRGYELK